MNFETISHELCRGSGVDATARLLEKLTDLEMPLYIGGSLIGGIREITHSGDGLTVVTVALGSRDGDDGAVFQFEPSIRDFSTTAVGADGEPICPCIPDR